MTKSVIQLSKGVYIPNYMVALELYKHGGKTISDIHRALEISFSHALHITESFIELEWAIYGEKDGRSKYVILTDKGKNIADTISVLFSILDIQIKDIENITVTEPVKEQQNIQVS